MLKLKIDRNPTGLEQAIDRLLSELANETADSEEYARMTDQLVKLHAMKTTEGFRLPSPDALIAAAANILGIILIVNYERVHVVTSKALPFIRPLSR